MPSHNVAVQREVYQALEREKRPGESFTRLFVRLLNQKGPLDEVTGSWGGAARSADRRWRRLRGRGERP